MHAEDFTEEQIETERAKMLSEARLVKSRIQRLKEDVGFQYYLQQLKEQYDRRIAEILAMPMGADDIIKRTHAIGEVAGIRLALDYPEVLIAYAQTSIDSANFTEEQEKRNGESSSESRTSSGTAAGTATDDDTDFDRDIFRAP